MESRLKIRRTSLRMTRKDLGLRSGVSAKSIQQYEDGLRKPSPGVMLNMARALQVSVSWLRGETEDPYVDDGVRIREYQEASGRASSSGVNLLNVAAGAVDLGLGGGVLALLDVVQREFDRRGEGAEFLDELELHIRRSREHAEARERAVDRLEEIQAEEKLGRLQRASAPKGRG